MLFQYTGDAEAPETTTIYDYYFELRGAPVEVTNPYHIEKLKNNGSFLWDDGSTALPEIESFNDDEITGLYVLSPKVVETEVAPNPKKKNK